MIWWYQCENVQELQKTPYLDIRVLSKKYYDNITIYPKVLAYRKASWVCLSYDLGMLTSCSPTGTRNLTISPDSDAVHLEINVDGRSCPDLASGHAGEERGGW